MAQPDPALGISVDFPTQTVRNGLLFAMQLGKPNALDRRLKFIMRTTTMPTYWLSVADVLAEDAAIGATELVLGDTGGLNPGGGEILLGTETYTYSAVVDDSVTLTSPLLTDHDAGEPVLVNVQLSTPPRLDRDGEPLDPNIEVKRNHDTELEVDAAVEVTAATQEELPPVGNFRPSKITITLMGQEYAQIEGCKECVYNGDRYQYGFEPEIDGLFDLDVHQIIFFAIEDA
jgi:hypothetical protein